MILHRNSTLSNSQENRSATGSEQICQDVQIIKVGKSISISVHDWNN